MLKTFSNRTVITEIYRKFIHLLGMFFPIIYHFIEKKTMVILISILLLLSFFIDRIRIALKLLEHPIIKKVGLSQMFRTHEKNGLSALTFAFTGMLICTIISTKIVFNLAVSIMILSDAVAAILGMLYGIHKINGKSIEGSIAFLTTSFIVGFFISYIYSQDFKFILSTLVASIIATIVELFSKNIYINDNMTIPVSVSIVMYILGYS